MLCFDEFLNMQNELIFFIEYQFSIIITNEESGNTVILH